MRKYKVKFKLYLYSELKNYLFQNSPSENGCFIMGSIRNDLLFITDILYPESPNDIYGCEEYCSPNSKYILNATLEARRCGKSLLFVHSHPGENHPAIFSLLDVESNERLFQNIQPILKMPVGSLVFSHKGIYGTMYENGIYIDILDYTILGKGMEVIPNYPRFTESKVEEEFARQEMMMPNNVFEQYKNLNILVVGCGGLGVPTAISLAKMGLKRLTVCDFDVIEKTNLPRLDCANDTHIGAYKVDVVREFIEVYTNCMVETHRQKVDEASIEISQYDMIFGCLDNHTARAFLNQQSIKYSIPYVDAGCAVPLGKDGTVIQSLGCITTVFPDRSCLWCTKTISAQVLNEEVMPKSEIDLLRENGYAQSLEKAPSIRSLTSLTAQFAVNRLFNLLGVYSLNFPVKVTTDVSTNQQKVIDSVDNSKCLCTVDSPF